MNEDYRLIPLTRGQFAKVDAADYELLMQWKWQARWKADIKSYYAVRSMTAAESGSAYKRPVVRMHRFVINAPSEMHVDHVNGDTLDNRRKNLRPATASQNSINSRIRSDNRYQAKGVRQHGKRWEARITLNGVTRHLGMFTTKEDASRAYIEASSNLHGEFARTQ